MVKVKSLEQIKENYKTGASVAPARYQAAVSVANWHDPATSDEAQALWVAKITDPAVQARRVRRMASVPNSVWQNQAKTVGGVRIGPGMTGAVDKQASGFAPYRSVLESIDLPARTTDPDTNIDNRVKPIARALHQKKMEL
jgi:predicted exporter